MGARYAAVAVLAAVVAAGSAWLHARAVQAQPPALHIEAPPELRPVATQLARADPAPFVDFAHRLGLEDSGPPIRVVLVAKDTALDRATPRWIAGFADPAAATIVLFPLRSPSYPHASLEAVLRHEVAHVLIARAAPGADIPRWLHEGLALSAERRGGLADQGYLALAGVFDRVRISALDAEFQAGERRAARAYAIAYGFVRDLDARYGADVPSRLLKQLAAGATLEQAFIVTTGTSLAAVEGAFWNGRWWYQVVPFMTSSLALWMGITLLALHAMRRQAARRAERRRRWDDDDEEAEPAADDGLGGTPRQAHGE